MVERDCLGGSRLPRAGVRLTEYEPDRSDDYVRRLDREATSFFFTNFPEDALAGNLWKLFAKYGRVGEVYIPQKLNKWGCRFGFVKYREVKNTVELERRLGEVWMGTFKLRVNLSRFAKGSSSNQPKQVTDRTSHGNKEKMVQPGISFKTAVTKNTEVTTTKVAENGKGLGESRRSGLEGALLVEPELSFLHVLKRSFVGRMVNGGDVKTLQLNLCLSGFRDVKVAALGGGKIILFSEPVIDLHHVISSKHWWNGVVEEFVEWSPNIVSSKRDIWVNIYGVPLQCWGELFFRMVTETCGEFLSVDVETRNKTRLDVARVKLSCPLIGFIDRVVPVMVQGVSSVTRVVEERGYVFAEDRDLQEDQLRWSVAASSCKSLGQGPVMAMVEESVMGDSDSDVSVGDQPEKQATKETTDGFDRMKKGTDVSFALSDSRRATSSIRVVGKEPKGDLELEVSVAAEKVRGLTSLEVGDACEVLKGHQAMVGPTVLRKASDVDLVDMGVGPSQICANLLEEGGRFFSGQFLDKGAQAVNGPLVVGLCSVSKNVEELANGVISDLSKKDSTDVPDLGHSMSSKLDSFLKGSAQRNNEGVVITIAENTICYLLSHEDKTGSEDSSLPLVKKTLLKNRKATLRPQSLPTLGGPKCLRFMGAVQASSKQGKHRKAVSLEEGVVWSAGKLIRGSKIQAVEAEGELEGDIVDDVSTSRVGSPVQQPLLNNKDPHSRVRRPLGEDSIEDVDRFGVK
ncbi:hypothetical protein TSUD_284340 [Trifolium subterraneum]|uniref:RRM domain-containing protein n=1 Tax=Trifolium subterraneum TaxID=3900 RepID=A0A2Z6N8H9_TRISU|nr:hypothetical protein TSUD_284340 [Trifolium subterraneum]